MVDILKFFERTVIEILVGNRDCVSNKTSRIGLGILCSASSRSIWACLCVRCYSSSVARTGGRFSACCTRCAHRAERVGASLGASRAFILRVIIVIQVHVSHWPFNPVKNRILRVLYLAGFWGRFMVLTYRLGEITMFALSALSVCIAVSLSLIGRGIPALLRKLSQRDPWGDGRGHITRILAQYCHQRLTNSISMSMHCSRRSVLVSW